MNSESRDREKFCLALNKVTGRSTTMDEVYSKNAVRIRGQLTPSVWETEKFCKRRLNLNC